MPTEAWEDMLPLKTYLRGPDDPFPTWNRRGHDLIYPYSMQDNLLEETRVLDYRALHLENEYVHAIVLPELGGKLYSLYDKLGKREVFYRNNVVKYGLVARRGAWISGGIEFNFPKGHTCLTVSPVLSELVDGPVPAIRVGGLDRTSRMRWTVKLELLGASLVQQVVLENPTPVRQRHYFWSNSAVPATDDLHLVYPAAKARTGGGIHPYPMKENVDLSWYRNHHHADDIFTLDVRDDFFGCYYEEQEYGLVHWSDHHRDFGKKFFTWGTGDDGMRWVDLLTDDDGQYVELQAGRFVDQSTFEFLFPFQQASWEERWWQVRDMGGFVWANEQAALNLEVADGRAEMAAMVTNYAGAARLVLRAEDTVLWQGECELAPGQPVRVSAALPEPPQGTKLRLSLLGGGGADEIISYVSPASHELRRTETVLQAPQTVQKPPESAQSYYVEGIKQEKLACYQPARAAFEKALELDPDHAPAHVGLGLLDYRSGLFAAARDHFYHATEQDVEEDEAWYYLALTDLELGRREEAEIVLWRLMGRTQCRDEAAVLLARMALQQNDSLAAEELLQSVRPSDYVARLREDDPKGVNLISPAYECVPEDPEECLERALEAVALGGPTWAVRLLKEALEASETARRHPLIHYYLGALDVGHGDEWLAQAKQADPLQGSASRLEDLPVLVWAAERNPQDWLARLLLGNLLAHLDRKEEALANWQTAATVKPDNPILCRNIGLALSLWQQTPEEGIAWYDRAVQAWPEEYHTYLERDQVMQTAKKSPEERLAALEQAPEAVALRFEVAGRRVECLVQLGRWKEALELLRSGRYLPYEGARGVHRLWVEAQKGLAGELREQGDLAGALAAYEAALTYPQNLSVGRTAFADEAELHWLAAEVAEGEARQTRLCLAAEEVHPRVTRGDAYKLRALQALGREQEAGGLRGRLQQWLAEHPDDRLAEFFRQELS